jgi:PspAA-like protein
MIVRILGEGQFSVPDELSAELDRLDGDLEAAVERGDEPAFTAALTSLLTTVRERGTEAPADTLEPSELILPHEGSSMDDVRQLLSDDGVSHS